MLLQAPPEAEDEPAKAKDAKGMSDAASGDDLEKGSGKAAKEKADQHEEERNDGPETEKDIFKRKRDLKFHLVMAMCSM